MVRGCAADEAADYGRVHSTLSIGIHIDLGEWYYAQGAWVPAYEVVEIEQPGAVASEISKQLARFRQLLGREPTHIDSHQHVHLREPARAAFLSMSKQMRVPLRHLSAVRYCGEFYGQTADGLPLPEVITVNRLIDLIQDLPPGLTELGCHPGYAEDSNTTYHVERQLEVAVLCDARLRPALDSLGIELCSFSSANVRALRAENEQTET
jgi:predicted glycoside hydrolase/deacetylase ChbG (UPF0249 family)